MSNILKVLLLLLVLGTFSSLIVTAKIVNQVNLKNAVYIWLKEERWLFFQGQERLRKRLASVFAALALYCVYFFDVPLSLWYGLQHEEIPEIADETCLILLGIFVICKIILFTRYNGAQLIVLSVFFGYFGLLQMISGYNTLGKAALMMVLAKDIALLPLLFMISLFHFANVAVNAFLSLGGYISMLKEIRENGIARMDFGFGSMNALGIITALAAVLWLLYRLNKLKWYDLMIVAAVLVFVAVVPNSRGAMLFEILAVVGMLLAKYRPELFKKRIVKILCCLPAPLISVVMWFLHFNYNKNVKWMLWLDKILTGRVSLSYITWTEASMQANPFPFFGQAFVGGQSFYRVDDSYIYYAYLCGPLMAFFLVIGFVLLTYKLLISGYPQLAVCVMTYACYATMERCLSGINFSLLFMPILLFGSNSLVLEKEADKAEGNKI